MTDSKDDNGNNHTLEATLEATLSKETGIAPVAIPAAEAMRNSLQMIDSGSVNVASFFDFLNLGSELEHVRMTPAQATKMQTHLASMKHGTYASVPLICAGPNKCPIISSCWFTERKEQEEDSNDSNEASEHINLKASNYPILRQCPVEIGIVKMKIRQHLEEFLGNGLPVTHTVMSLITKLAELDIYENRANFILAKGDRFGSGMNLLTEVIDVMGGEMNDTPYYKMVEHPILAVKDRLTRQKDKILQQLLATPEAQIKARAALGTKSKDTAAQLSEMNEMLHSLVDHEAKAAEGIIDVVAEDSDSEMAEHLRAFNRKNKGSISIDDYRNK